MYAWESAVDGLETTPKWAPVDVMTGKQIPILCGEIEHHISADIAYALWHYHTATGDEEFMLDYGYEILFETANFWNSRLEYNSNKGLYEINNVIGPDEYSEHVHNNAYTNYLVLWHLHYAAESSKKLRKNQPQLWFELNEKLDLNGRTAQWLEKSNKIHYPKANSEGVIPQDDGFMDRRTIDLTPFQDGSRSIFSTMGWREIVDSQVLKQADLIMLFFLLGDQFPLDIKKANWDFYEPKTLHDSSLSAGIHSVLASELGLDNKAYQYFEQACRIDLNDDSQSSVEGLHAASFGSVWLAVVMGFAGMKITGDTLNFSPRLPKFWKHLKFRIHWQRELLQITIDRSQVTLAFCEDSLNSLKIVIYGREYDLKNGSLSVPCEC